jgi:hypothetical protein
MLPPLHVTADMIVPLAAPVVALDPPQVQAAPLAAAPPDPLAGLVPVEVALPGTEDEPLALDAVALLERAGLEPGLNPVIGWVGGASHGQVFLGEDGLLRFLPEADYHGSAAFSALVLGGMGGTVLTEVSIKIDAVNDAPVPIGDSVLGAEDRALLFAPGALLANDRDPDIASDGDWLRVSAVGAPEHGAVELLPDGSVRFTPEPDFWGTAGFTYTVADAAGASATGQVVLSLASVNDAPLAFGEEITSGVEDTALLIDPALLLANDADIDTATDGDVLSVSGVFGAEHGTASLLADGTVEFLPEADFHGSASFRYTVADGRGGTAEAQTRITVASVNDAPVGVDEALLGAEDSPLLIAPAVLLANELDPDIATDGQALRVIAVGEASGGAVGLAPDGTIVFVPETDSFGEAGFTYTIADGAGGLTSARARIDIAPVEDPPIAGADGFAGLEDTTLIVDPALLIANDRDPDGDRIHFAGVSGATHGEVSLTPEGEVRFVPQADFFGRARFDYLVADQKGNLSEGSAFVTLENVNDAPRVETIEYGRPVYAYTLSSGSDGEGNWSSTLRPVYDAAEAAALYAAGEARSASGTALAPSYYQNATLKPIDFEPTESETLDPEGGSYAYDSPLLAEGRIIAYDPDGDTLSFSLAAQPAHGSSALGAGFSLAEANAWRYQSTYGDPYSGPDPFVARVSDPSGAATSATVQSTHYGTLAGGGGGGGCCPVMIDLDADGVELIAVDDSQLLRDLDGDGWMERLGWSAEDDALLAYDADEDGFITRAEEISFVAYTPGARTDLEGLAAFDSDGDGRLTALDPQWGRFHLWQDRGADGRADPGELTPLAATDISAIGLASDGQVEARGGNLLFGRASYARADGSVGEVGDVMFGARPTEIAAAPPPAPSPQQALEAHFARLALQLVQDMAAFDPRPPGELDLPPSAPPPELTLAENPLARHEQGGASGTG